MKINLKNTKTISTIGFVILIALIWFIGPFIEWSIEDCLKLISVVMVLWVLTLLVGQVVAMRAGRLLEKMFHSQADDAIKAASAARRAEVNLLREQLLKAVNTLKTSKLGKARGSAVLYELPWYMIIGHSAAGKSTALLQSGLTFPFSEQGVSVRGVGGTRNCDWFFSTEGVLLDTAGRYSTQTDDRDEWLGFLRLLKRHRSKAPVNGILIATSLPELVQYQSEAFTTYARQIRERIHEIEDIFGLRMPIYLVFTKLDLLGGFGQFFEYLDEAGRDCVWGATLSHELDLSVDIRREVERQCELLYRGIRQIGEEKLGLPRGVGSKPALFAFPLEFHALKDGIGRFVELLHENDPYHAKPLLRGFYFTSALQSSDPPHITAATRVSSQFGLTRSGFKAAYLPASSGYFLRDLFQKVLFPDQYLIQRQTRPGSNRLRLTGMAASVGVLGVSIMLLTQSWLGNRNMLDLIGVNKAQAAELVAQEPLADKLNGLILLQKHLEELQQHRIDGVPWKIGAGLYQGHKLETDLRKQYFDEIHTLMLMPLQDSLEKELKHISSVATSSATPAEGYQAGNPETIPESYQKPESSQEPAASRVAQVVRFSPDEGYEALKTYLMLADERSHLDADYLGERMARYWHPWLEAQRGAANMDEVETESRQLVAFYVSQLQAQMPDVPLIGNQSSVVEDARLVLRNATNRPQAKELVYNELRDRANARYPALSVVRILDGKDGAIVGGVATVPGAFTREALDKYMREAITVVSRGEIKGDDWVLAVSVSDDPGKNADEGRNRAEIEALYRADYAKAWMEFLKGVVIIARPGDIAQAEQMLERLADPRNSPIKIILQRAAYETAWDNPAQISNAVGEVRDSARTAAKWVGGQQGRIPNVNILQEGRYGILGRQFAALAAVSDSDKQGTPLLAGYLEHLGRLKGQLNPVATSDDESSEALKLILATLDGNGSEFTETLRYIDNILLGAVNEQTLKDILRPLLATPLLQSYKTLLPPVEEALDDIWQSEVHEQWVTLAGKYPFSDSQDEARFADITHFLGSGGTVDKFVQENLKGLVIKRAGQLAPRTWADLGVRFNQQFMSNIGRLAALGNTLSRSGGAESSRFELRPVPTPGLSEITVEIDGQVLRYRNGPQAWQAFNWPGGDSQGARIQVISFNGTVSTVSSQPGRMGLMRMIGESTRKLDTNMSTGQMEWRFRGADGVQPVKLDFRATGGLNPMQLVGLSHINLPTHVTR